MNPDSEAGGERNTVFTYKLDKDKTGEVCFHIWNFFSFFFYSKTKCLIHKINRAVKKKKKNTLNIDKVLVEMHRINLDRFSSTLHIFTKE